MVVLVCGVPLTIFWVLRQRARREKLEAQAQKIIAVARPQVEEGKRPISRQIKVKPKKAKSKEAETGPRAEEEVRLTCYEQSIQQRKDEGEIPEGVDDFAVRPERRGTVFFQGLVTTRKTHKLGAAVEVKDKSFYTDPSRRLYLAPDGSAGVALTTDGDVVSVFKVRGSPQNIDAILDQASKEAKTLVLVQGGDRAAGFRISFWRLEGRGL